MALVVHRKFEEWCETHSWMSRLLATGPGTAARVALTFLFVLLLWVPFRSATFEGAAEIYRGLFAFRSGLGTPASVFALACITALVALAHWLGSRDRWRTWLASLPEPILGIGQSRRPPSASCCWTSVVGNLFVYFPVLKFDPGGRRLS